MDNTVSSLDLQDLKWEPVRTTPREHTVPSTYEPGHLKACSSYPESWGWCPDVVKDGNGQEFDSYGREFVFPDGVYEILERDKDKYNGYSMGWVVTCSVEYPSRQLALDALNAALAEVSNIGL